LGHFIINEEEEKNKVYKNMHHIIKYEDKDICENLNNFVEFAKVELSLSGLKYGQKYRNNLNGLLFKQTKPFYVGNLNFIIRINKETDADIYNLHLNKYCNVSLN